MTHKYRFPLKQIMILNADCHAPNNCSVRFWAIEKDLRIITRHKIWRIALLAYHKSKAGISHISSRLGHLWLINLSHNRMQVIISRQIRGPSVMAFELWWRAEFRSERMRFFAANSWRRASRLLLASLSILFRKRHSFLTGTNPYFLMSRRWSIVVNRAYRAT